MVTGAEIAGIISAFVGAATAAGTAGAQIRQAKRERSRQRKFLKQQSEVDASLAAALARSQPGVSPGLASRNALSAFMAGGPQRAQARLQAEQFGAQLQQRATQQAVRGIGAGVGAAGAGIAEALRGTPSKTTGQTTTPDAGSPSTVGVAAAPATPAIGAQPQAQPATPAPAALIDPFAGGGAVGRGELIDPFAEPGKPTSPEVVAAVAGTSPAVETQTAAERMAATEEGRQEAMDEIMDEVDRVITEGGGTPPVSPEQRQIQERVVAEGAAETIAEAAGEPPPSAGIQGARAQAQINRVLRERSAELATPETRRDAQRRAIRSNDPQILVNELNMTEEEAESFVARAQNTARQRRRIQQQGTPAGSFEEASRVAESTAAFDNHTLYEQARQKYQAGDRDGALSILEALPQVPAVQQFIALIRGS